MTETPSANDGLDAIFALAEKHEIEMPSEEALADLRKRIEGLRGTKRWSQVADMTRQAVERYLEDAGLSSDLAPILAGILAREGEPWALVKARIVVNATHGGRRRGKGLK